MGALKRHSSSSLLTPAFQGDAGGADPALAAALVAYETGTGTWRGVLRTFATARVLVPIQPLLASTQLTGTGLPAEKESQMALVTVAGRDGRRALPAFTSMATFGSWQGELRPVAVEGARAARTAVDDGAAALLVDPRTPTRFVITGADLERLAAVWTAASAGAMGGPPTDEKEPAR